jgi:hypothetical protein
MKKFFICCLFSTILFSVSAQFIPQSISYTRIYDFLDELATDGIIELKSVVRPYSRMFIAQRLLEAKEQQENLNRRQRQELVFHLNDFALERSMLPESLFDFGWVVYGGRTKLSTMQPGIFYLNDNQNIRIRMTPILGMHIRRNGQGQMTDRWFGAEFQASIGRNFSIWGSLRDISMWAFDNDLMTQSVRRPYRHFLVNAPGFELKEATYGGDFSDFRGGIAFSNDWMTLGLVQDRIVWGDNNNGSNLISGRAPPFPMIKFQLRPTRWFQLDYFHGWLVSNVADSDSTRFIVESPAGTVWEEKWAHQTNKFMAANMLTFRPVRGLNISVGNAIIYSEPNMQPAYLFPIAFYKSMAHSLTKGIGTQNGNSAIFLNLSSRNIRHLHLYSSLFVDEVTWARFRPSHPENNPMSWKIGAQLSNFPVQNLSLTGEFTRTNILTYKHSLPVETWASNSVNMGHYLGDNAQEIHFALHYRPIRGLDLSLSFTDARKGNYFDFFRHRGVDWNGVPGNVRTIISHPVMQDIIWRNTTFGFRAVYEVFNNAYAIINIEHNNARGFDNPIGHRDSEGNFIYNPRDAMFAERVWSADEALRQFTPSFLHGRNTTLTLGFSFGF